MGEQEGLSALLGSGQFLAGGLQAGIGSIQSALGNAKLKKLRQRRQAYQTPQEFFDMAAMAQNQAQTGLGAESMAYFSNESSRALTASLGVLKSLGGDANSVADVLDRNLQAIKDMSFKNEVAQYNKMGEVYKTTQALANEKIAEWADKEAKLKDDMASAATKVAAGNKNLQSGINSVYGALANEKSKDLYSTDTVNSEAYMEKIYEMNRNKGKAKVGQMTVTAPTPEYDSEYPIGLEQYFQSINPYNPTRR